MTSEEIIPPQADRPLPFNVITGFLGAGKTTLLNALLKHPGMADTMVIVNEFGEAGLDHLLVEASEDEVIELSSGCLCCALRGDLVETLIRLLEGRGGGEIKPFRRIVVETSGLADPAPILHSIMGHPWLTERLRLDGVVAVVDAVNGEATLDNYAEAVKQAAMAERIVIAKADLLGRQERAGRLAMLERKLRDLNPAADLLISGEDPVGPEQLFYAGLYDERTERVDAQAWLRAEAYEEGLRGHHHGHADHTSGIDSFAISLDRALEPMSLEVFMDLLRANFGGGLLRVKGIVKLSDDEGRPVVIHGVQHIFHPPARLAAWPFEPARTRIVFITRGVRRADIEKLFAVVSDPVTGGGAAKADDALSLLPGGDS